LFTLSTLEIPYHGLLRYFSSQEVGYDRGYDRGSDDEMKLGKFRVQNRSQIMSKKAEASRRGKHIDVEL
jgi:hypothetical protein